MAWELLPTNYADARFDGLRQYLQIQNANGTLSFEDVTAYITKENSFFGAKDANAINEAVNAIMTALENGTDLYTVFQEFFENQKEAFAEEYETEINAMLANESARVTAENERAQAEKTRQSQEVARQNNTAQAISDTNTATLNANNATAKCTAVTERAEEALQSQEQLDATLNSVTKMEENIAKMEQTVTEAQEQVAADKEEIDDTIKNSLLASSEEILASVKDYFERAEALYNSMYLNCDGETPKLRTITPIVIDGGTPAQRAIDGGIHFDGGTPMSRKVAS